PCRSEPARDGVRPVNMDVECSSAIASRLAPTLKCSGTRRNNQPADRVEIEVNPSMGFTKEAPMQKWKVTFVDDHGETINEVFESTERPDYERAARLIKARL